MYLADSRNGSGRPEGDGARWRTRGVPGTVFALGAVSLITDVSAEMVTAVLPLYLAVGLGLPPVAYGLLDGTQNGVAALVRLLGGHLADRGGGRHKAVAAVGYTLSALCKPLLLIAHTVPAVVATIAVDRTGKGLRTAPRDAMISLAAGPGRRARAFGVHRAMDTAGALIGPLAAFGILQATRAPLSTTGSTSAYEAVFVVSSCAAALGVVVLLLFVPRARRPAGPVERLAREPRLRDFAGLLKQRDMARLTCCSALLGLTATSDGFLYLLIQRRFELPNQWFPLLPLATAAAFLLLAIPVGALADRVGRRATFLAGHMALLAVYGLLAATPATTVAVVPAVLILHGLFYAGTDGVLAAAAGEAVPTVQQGSGIAVVGSGQALARIVGSLGFGAAWSSWGERTAVVLAAAGLCLSLAVCRVLLSPRTAPVRTRPPGSP
ncbi:MFS transporter [Streptomyces actinomycinicus]|uniref:MFS transporter n=1 Tax=Streptomyces actinomycinicus TaxID=1695166 RepID=A0A937ESA8_9ACTN|nr:MFS transporter [Streptomyces actinomycinicus]MBL1087555.1 MFS transporter [Streptomyces actinomycinicus]